MTLEGDLRCEPGSKALPDPEIFVYSVCRVVPPKTIHAYFLSYIM